MPRARAGLKFISRAAVAGFCALPTAAGAEMPIVRIAPIHAYSFAASTTLERGSIEPSDNTLSYQRAGWNLYSIGASYNFGELGPLRALGVRIDGTYFYAPAEVNDTSRRSVPSGECPGVPRSALECEFHPKDEGGILSPTLVATLVDDGPTRFDLFVRGALPIHVDLGKFAAPRVDFVAGGANIETRFAPWLAMTDHAYIATGAIGSSGTHNASTALAHMFVFRSARWVVDAPIALGVGPWFEGDLSRHFDDRYDRVFARAYRSGERDRIQAMSFSLASTATIGLTGGLRVELGFWQKFIAYQAKSTQTFRLGLEWDVTP